MLKAFIIVLSLLSLGISESIHCDNVTAQAAESTYNTRYIIPQQNGQVDNGDGGQDNFLLIQKYVHTYYSESSAQTQITLISVLKSKRNTYKGDSIRLDITQKAGHLSTQIIAMNGTIQSFKAYKQSISVVVYKNSYDRIITIKISSGSNPKTQIVASQSQVIIYNYVWASGYAVYLTKDHIVEYFTHDYSQYYYFVRIASYKYVILTNSGNSGYLSTVFAQLNIGSYQANLKCYVNHKCFDYANKYFYSRYGTNTALGAYYIIDGNTKTVSHFFRFFEKFSMYSVTDSSSGSVNLNLHIYQDETNAAPTYRGQLSNFLNVGSNRLSVVTSGLLFVVEYHQSIGIRFQFATSSNQIIVAIIKQNGAIFSELTSSAVQHWHSETNRIFVIKEDQIMHIQTIISNLATKVPQKISTTTGTDPVITTYYNITSSTYPLYLLTESNNQVIHTRTLSISEQALEDLEADAHLITYLKAECLCLYNGDKLFKCFTNGMCLVVVDYDQQQCNQVLTPI